MRIVRWFSHIDWILISAFLAIAGVGLVTMQSFSGANVFFERQVVWLCISLLTLIALSFLDVRFLRRTSVVVTLYLGTLVLLIATLLIGTELNGAMRWISIGAFSLQTSDPAKIILILVLAKYFSRRHIEIAHPKHIFISGLYAFLFFVPIFLQPDLGSAIIIFFIWLSMVLVSGISKKHLGLVFLVVLVVFGALWVSVFEEYQKERIQTFLHPLADIQGAGYNAYQSTVAVGSGQIIGKGIGFGTQSKLQFLPEYETDFIFASFAEEWGFVGVVFLFSLFGIVLWRILASAGRGASNFERLFSAGIALLILIHFTVHVGMNIGVLPVTGTTLPFMSYGGSHVLTECISLGVIMGMRRYGRSVQAVGALDAVPAPTNPFSVR